MRHFLYVLIALAVIASGCDTPHKLDWDTTAKQQGLKLGDVLQVEGLCYDIVSYKVGEGEVNRFIEGYEIDELVFYRQDWKDRKSKIDVDVYNPDGDGGEFNPTVPIGIVICTIYNPSFYESLDKLVDMYPEKAVGTRNVIEHHITFTGEIYSFQKYELSATKNKPARYYNCVRMHVQDIEVISSESYEIKTKKAE